MPYVSTGAAARALGVDIRSLQRWVQRGDIEPDYVTPGGHYRWDVERIRAELYQRLRDRREQ
ncbi:MAG: MerR family transcriptional regulator [Pseudonocardiaceae bacterium]